MNIKTIIANRANYGNSRALNRIAYIVIHYTANDGDSSNGNGNYFKNNIRGASAHYFVDDGNVVQSVPDNYVAYSVGGKKYADCKKTGGGTYYGICCNTNSLSIELCDTAKNGVLGFTEATLNNAAELVGILMQKYNVPLENVIRHFDVTGKLCPRPFTDEREWEEFKEQLKGEEKMTAQEKQEFDNLKKRVDELEKSSKRIYHYTTELPDYARATVQKLLDKGIYAGASESDLNLPETLMRTLVINDRAGLYK